MWQGIYGHDDVVERFRRIRANGRLEGSYLFLGPEGIGKRTFALKLAQALLCQSGGDQDLEPCGQCESCRLALAGNHPDIDVVGLPPDKRELPIKLFVGEKERRNKEGLCYNVSRRPQMGSRRVAIIDDADCFNSESANCLLKTLEEPPPGALMILIGTSRGRQLPTILSRTQTVRFSALEAAILSQLLLEQGLVTDPGQAGKLALASGGSLSQAALLVDPDLWEMRQRLLPLLTPSRLESARLANELVAFVNQAGKEAAHRRQRLAAVLQMVAEHFRLLLRSTCGVPEEADFGPGAQACALEVIDRCLVAEAQLDQNANLTTLVECWLDDLAEIFAGCPC